VRADPADDEELQDVLRVVLQAITGRPQEAAEVATLFQERFKSAGGGRRLLLGPPPAQPNSSPQASQVGHPTITLAIQTSKCLNSCIVVTATCPS